LISTSASALDVLRGEGKCGEEGCDENSLEAGGLARNKAENRLLLIAVPRFQTFADPVGDFQEFRALANIEWPFAWKS
jgi:hypothetical protein